MFLYSEGVGVGVEADHCGVGVEADQCVVGVGTDHCGSASPRHTTTDPKNKQNINLNNMKISFIT